MDMQNRGAGNFPAPGETGLSRPEELEYFLMQETGSKNPLLKQELEKLIDDDDTVKKVLFLVLSGEVCVECWDNWWPCNCMRDE